MSGLPTPDLIWQLNGQTIRPDSAHKMLVRENGVHSLVIEPVTSRDAGIYTCIASNRAGQNSFNLELIVAGKQNDQHEQRLFFFFNGVAFEGLMGKQTVLGLITSKLETTWKLTLTVNGFHKHPAGDVAVLVH